MVKKKHRHFHATPKSSYRDGHKLDAQDGNGKWYHGTVVMTTKSKMLIHYEGWPDYWDEWFCLDSNRLRKFRTTGGGHANWPAN